MDNKGKYELIEGIHKGGYIFCNEEYVWIKEIYNILKVKPFGVVFRIDDLLNYIFTFLWANVTNQQLCITYKILKNSVPNIFSGGECIEIIKVEHEEEDPEIEICNLQINGLPRFQRDASYFNYTQPSSNGIYCYSFALHPENYQPSGSVNFTRIDNAELMKMWEQCEYKKYNIYKYYTIYDLVN